MFAKRLLQKATQHHNHNHDHKHNQDDRGEKQRREELNVQIFCHLGIPNTSSILAVDPIQRLLAIGTLDGRIKVLGGDSIEGLLISPKQLPYKNLEFLQNQGYLVGILNDNDIQVWNLEARSIVCGLQWESNITAFSVIPGSLFMLVGDEYGRMFVLKYAVEDGKIIDMPYRLSPDCIAEKAGIAFPNDQPVVGVLPQPTCYGDRLLIAYQYGIIILWDVVEAKVVVLKGDRDLLIKDHASGSSSDALPDKLHEDMNEKEISALCWASSVGSMLAVGYTDGDILLWSLSRGTSSKRKSIEVSCDDVVKLQLSSAQKRLPVITLHWRGSSESQKGCSGQLFVYGGCDIGSEEVITVVSLEWFPGMETLKSVHRVDLALSGAFADIVFLSSLETASSHHYDGLFVLTRPGKVQYYDMKSLCTLASQQDRKSSASGLECPVVVPTSDPQMTATKFISQPYDEKWSMWLSEMTSVESTPNASERRKWPLSGGIMSGKSSAEQKPHRIYIAGYQDGSVRIWDATHPIFSLVSILEGQVQGIEIAGSNVSVTNLDFCESVMSLAVGTKCGAVRLYSLNAGVTKLYWVKHHEREVSDITPSKGPQCRAVFSLVNSPVCLLDFFASGAKLAVGFENSHVAVLDMLSLSVLFLTDPVANSMPPIISVVLRTITDSCDLSKAANDLGPGISEQTPEDLMITLSEDAKVNIINCKTGNNISARPLHLKKEHTAISMYVLEGSNPGSASISEQHEKETTSPHESKHEVVTEERLLDSLLLLCCQDVLRLYHMKSVIQGDDKPFCKVKLTDTCCWTSILKTAEKLGLIMVYQSGKIELRSLPSLELLTESSLTSAFRWNFRPKMEKLATCTEDGHICLANGSELAFFSFTGENEIRESVPLLHDKVLAAAADAAICHSLKQKKQVAPAGILGGISNGFKKEKSNFADDVPVLTIFLQLEEIFSQPIRPDLPLNTVEHEEEEEVEELDIDDIEIDEPVSAASTSFHQAKGKTNKSDRERLLEGVPMDTKPRMRTPEEIMAAYKGAEYASAAAERARNKLLERQGKLERINQRSEDLRHEAEDFASMANELVRTMERKNQKWWKI